MHDFLPVNQMTRRLDLVQQRPDIEVPFVEHVVREFVLREHDDSVQSINFGRDSATDDHVSNFNLNPAPPDAH